jgi:hypothetical protein
MASKTIDRHCLLHNFTAWVVESTPFFPRFKNSEKEGSEDTFDIVFNEGYIYDYANGGERKIVSGPENEEDSRITLGETKKYQIKITIDDASGAISKAEIVVNADTSASEDFTNLKNLSAIEGVLFPETKYIVIDLMELEGPHVNEFYVRENLHLWFRGFSQKGGAGHAPLKQRPSDGANDIIEFRELLEDPREDNILEISTVGDSIIFYVPSGSGSDEYVTEVEASTTQGDNRLTVTSVLTDSGIKYSLYVPPCSCECSCESSSG